LIIQAKYCLPLLFWKLKAGRAKTLKAKIRQEKRKVFLTTAELSIKGENHGRPVLLLASPQAGAYV
jgi:hypothetical protein